MCAMKSVILGLLCALTMQVARADLILELSADVTQHGAEGGTTHFVATITGNAGERLVAYDLFFDVGGVDLNFPTPTPLTIVNYQSLAFNGSPLFDPRSPAGNNRDIGVSDFNLTGPVPTAGGLQLFSFDVIFAANTSKEPVEYAILFDRGAAGFGLRLESGLVTDFTSTTFRDTNTRVAIGAVGVPEPSSMAWLGLVLVGTVLFTRQRIRPEQQHWIGLDL